MASKQYLCVHAHFYQPPRENPITGMVPDEPGATPYRNWNERIFENCYKPNIELGNFSRISFNIGPTISQWIKVHHPDSIAQIVKADQQNVERYGVGNAIAQPYHHTILPLATRHDKQTQMYWGIREFENTYHRKPQGMWLPETAVDMETLELLAENGIEFTILAPWQVEGREVDGSQAYQVILPNHRSIKIFFYHSGLSSRISFDPTATQNADAFIHNYVKPEFSGRSLPQWLMLASDGELYGHHQVFRDKFLSHLLNGSISTHHIEPTFPALQMKQQKVFPVIKIRNGTSWSCHHGIERWKGDCACTPNNEWKKPLREALNQLVQKIEGIYLHFIDTYIEKPWEARDQYVEVILGNILFADWLKMRTNKDVPDSEITKFEKLYEALYSCQRMYSSCAWFFEDLDRIEPRNSVVYAAHAVWLIKNSIGIDLTQDIYSNLAKSRSWQTGITAGELFLQATNRFNQV